MPNVGLSRVSTAEAGGLLDFEAFQAAPNRDEDFVARYLAVSVETIRAWRKQGRGPRFRKIGRCVRYSLQDLAEWIAAQPGGGGGA